MDICCLQKVRCTGEAAVNNPAAVCFFGVKRRRYKLWWCGNDDKIGGVGILVKEKLCENVVEVRRRYDRVVAIGLVLQKEVVRVICAYAPQSGKPDTEERFYEEMARQWSKANTNELVLKLRDFNGHVGKCAEGFEGIHGGYRIGKRNAEGRMLLHFSDQKESCVANMW